MTSKKTSRRSELFESLWTFRNDFLLVAVLSFLANLLMLSPSLYMLQVFDRVLASQSELTLVAVSLITLFLLGVMAFSEWLRSRVLVRAGMRFDERLSTRAFEASFEARLQQSGTADARTFSDLMQVRQFLTGAGVIALLDAPWAPIYIAVTFMLHPVLGWITIGFVLVQAALAWFGHRRTVKPAEAAARANSESNAFLQNKLRNAEVLESMGMIENLRGRWLSVYQGWIDRALTAQSVAHRVTAWSKFVRYSQQSLALGAGALLVIDGQLSPGAMIASNLLIARALAPIDQLVGIWRSIASAREAFGRLDALLVEHPQRPASASRERPAGAIRLHGVGAAALGRDRPILQEIDLDLPAGTVLAVLGPSGSGKSTLARVIAGIWPDVSGEVLLDGHPIGDWNRIELGPHLGYLPQDIELFDGTIAENIARLGEIDSDQVIAAARSAGLHEAILRFPKGYDTPIGERGGLLSGGQKQRIALARAIYGQPSLVVLDEPNANLDDTGEAALLRAIAELKAKGSTVVLVSHRAGAISVADRVMLLREGRVLIEGARDQVLAALKTGNPPAAASASATPLPA